MLEVNALHAGYKKIPALHGVSLNVERGEIVCILGSNGAGKSSTLRAISRLIQPTSGRVVFNGVETTRMPCHQIVQLGLLHVPEGRQIFPEMTVLDHLELSYVASKRHELSLSAAKDEVFDLFPKLRERVDQYAGSLSGGEQQMLAIARGLMCHPLLLMLDEPSLGLAPVVVDVVADTILALRKKGITILLVEQNLRLALELADRGYVLEHGEVTLEGSSKELLNDPRVKSAYLGK